MQYNYERISNWKKNTSKGIFNKNLQSFQFSHGFHVVSSHFYRNHAILSPETRCESRLLDAANPLPGADATKQEALAWRFLSELVIIQGLVLIFLYIITILLIIIMYIYIYYKYIMYISIYIYIYRLTVLEVLNQPRMKAIKDCFFIGSLTPVCHPSHGEPARILFFVVSHSYSCYMLLSWPPGMVDSN